MELLGCRVCREDTLVCEPTTFYLIYLDLGTDTLGHPSWNAMVVRENGHGAFRRVGVWRCSTSPVFRSIRGILGLLQSETKRLFKVAKQDEGLSEQERVVLAKNAESQWQMRTMRIV